MRPKWESLHKPYSKYGSGKMHEAERIGRLNRAEKRYRKNRLHKGKTKTLRDHRH